MFENVRRQMMLVEEEIKEVVKTVRQSFKKETPQEIEKKIVDNEEKLTESEINRISQRVTEIGKPKFSEL